MHISPIVERTLISLAVITSFGVLIHDTKIDQATALAVALPVGLVLTLPSLHGDGHTHAERGAYGKTTVLGMPRVQPRDDHRKYLLAKRSSGFNSPGSNTLELESTLL